MHDTQDVHGADDPAGLLLKEIFEQEHAVVETISLCKSITKSVWKALSLTPEEIAELRSVTLVASGSSWHAARIAQFFFESICRLPVRVFLASEFKYMPFFPEKGSVCIVISHSGETGDSIEALRVINAFEVPTVALTSVASSTLVREAGGFLLTSSAGLPGSVSIKGFTTQIAALYWLAHRIAFERGIISKNRFEYAPFEVTEVAHLLRKGVEEYRSIIIEEVVPTYLKAKQFIFLGRHITYPLAAEAALKTKELSRIFAQSYPAGELKHGPFAIVDATVPIALFSHNNPLMYQKIVATARELKARSSALIAFMFEGQHELEDLADTAFVIPRINQLLAPIPMAGLLQLFAYQLGVARGHYSHVDYQSPSDYPDNQLSNG